MDEGNRTHKPRTGDLLSSAKVLAGAAKAAASHETDGIDKGKVAGAAADLLGAASHYGKLEEKSFGKYVGKAENYLHKYQTTANVQHAQDGGSAPAGGSHGGKHGDDVETAEGTLEQKKNDGVHQAGDGGDAHQSGGEGGHNYGDYIKLAKGYLKKN